MNKKIIFSNSIILILFINFSFCQEKSDYAILSGTIKNGKKTIELSASYGYENKNKIIHLNENGTFLDSINTKKGLYFIWDKTNMIPFYISPSKKYTINYNVTKFRNENVTLSGSDVAINEYFINRARNKVFFDPSGSGKSEKEFRSFLKSIKEE